MNPEVLKMMLVLVVLAIVLAGCTHYAQETNLNTAEHSISWEYTPAGVHVPRY